MHTCRWPGEKEPELILDGQIRLQRDKAQLLRAPVIGNDLIIIMLERNIAGFCFIHITLLV